MTCVKRDRLRIDVRKDAIGTMASCGRLDGHVGLTFMPPGRVSAFSDGAFAFLITVLVLELRPPDIPTFKALLLIE